MTKKKSRRQGEKNKGERGKTTAAAIASLKKRSTPMEKPLQSGPCRAAREPIELLPSVPERPAHVF